ncbi:MAG: hypothetical protein ACR2JB_12775 [Bryobacteraceae bacterium]
MRTTSEVDIPREYASFPSGDHANEGPVLVDLPWTEPWAGPWPAGDRDPLVLVGSTTFQNQQAVLHRLTSDARNSSTIAELEARFACRSRFGSAGGVTRLRKQPWCTSSHPFSSLVVTTIVQHRLRAN